MGLILARGGVRSRLDIDRDESPVDLFAGRPAPAEAGCGAIAQLGERLNGIQEVRGSTPLGSTNFFQALISLKFKARAPCVHVDSHPSSISLF